MGNCCSGEERKEGEAAKEKNILDHIGDSFNGAVDAAKNAAEAAKNAAESGVKAAGDLAPKGDAPKAEPDVAKV
eukprot:CAMPEP_0113694280 /NCGR_PEP_ID=MMETSP0038_2-20120614/20181_1 /TAXON_ID=2898 /ORGANISM="Cryptomonas paramecium" /LENGTH=73 /DNA_ID=CAMNT_0000616543 /DNA_START=17 /DNA_END=238 /DNA_ORIENTATION=+ /assembly_acc=CAM_ASM_000170